MQRRIDYLAEAEDGELIKILSAFSEGDIVEERDVAAFFPPRPRQSHKGSFGKACLIAGSEQYLGAAALSISSTLRTGCGYVYAVVPDSFRYALAAFFPQCIYCQAPPNETSAIAIGMGLCRNERTFSAVRELLENYGGKIILDADGLNALAAFGKEPLKRTRAQTLITPHVGEMARLCGLSVEEVERDPVGVASDFAREYGVTVHLKGAVSVTCGLVGGELKRVLNVNGTSALAKAGSGDILSGLICGNAARGLSLFDAAVCSRYVLGAAAELCAKEQTDYAVTSGDIINSIPEALKRLTGGF